MAWFRDFASPDVPTQQKSADRAYWPLLPPPSAASNQLADDRIAIGVAQDSPYAPALTNACGADVIARSQWLRICPGPCSAPASSQSLIGHFFLIDT